MGLFYSLRQNSDAMKKIVLCVIAVVSALTVYSQDMSGQWNGALKVPGAQLRLVFHITATEQGYRATMDSPDQGATGIPVTTTLFEDSVLTLKVANAGIAYRGRLADNTVVGEFKQAGQTFHLNLTKGVPGQGQRLRPQEPTEPSPYRSEDVIFKNTEDTVTLVGTLTMPEKGEDFPAVVLISGSGPQDRNEEITGHKPFLVLADHLTRRGIAVLRYDDRGTAASSGNFGTATTLDFASDVASAVEYLRTREEIDPHKIGLIGHSEGGLIAPIVATETDAISFMVLLASPGVPGGELLLQQQEAMGRASGMPEAALQQAKAVNGHVFKMIAESSDADSLNIALTDYLRQTMQQANDTITTPTPMDDYIRQQVAQLTTPWMRYFIRYSPAPTLQKVTCPVLALNGENDLQVPAQENLTSIGDALEQAGNSSSTLKELPDLNHLFQKSDTGLPAEYATIEQTFSPVALSVITRWVKKQVK